MDRIKYMNKNNSHRNSKDRKTIVIYIHKEMPICIHVSIYAQIHNTYYIHLHAYKCGQQKTYKYTNTNVNKSFKILPVRVQERLCV